MKNHRNRESGRLQEQKIYILNLDLLESYQKLCKGETISTIIKHHKRLILSLNLIGKRTPKSLLILQNFKKTKNKELALSILINTLNNKNIFRL